MIRIVTYALGALALLAAVGLLMGLPAGSGASPDLTQTPSATPAYRAHLPLVRYDPSPTPAPTPTQMPSSAAAALFITPFRAINASTFNPSAFVVANDSVGGERLIELRIDLSTAVFPDMVFDPYGQAGDTVAKDLTVDVRQGTGLLDYRYEQPHDGGFDVLVLRFSGFDRGDRFEFSVDVDPTSITGVGAPGPAESGSVGGLELVGATVTATFDGGLTITNQAYRMAEGGNAGSAHSGALAALRLGVPPRPIVQIPGLTTPALVNNPSQVIRVVGPAGSPVTVLVVEGGLFTQGLPNGGFDLDPFEANSAVTVREYAAVVGLPGFVDVPVQLTKTTPESGIHLISAVFDDHYGLKGLVAEPVVLQLQ